MKLPRKPLRILNSPAKLVKAILTV
ncbi:uncharacterized protein METZ01_LOCUS177746, partial [marine metagenome]